MAQTSQSSLCGTSQKYWAGPELQHCVFQTDCETKNETRVSLPPAPCVIWACSCHVSLQTVGTSGTGSCESMGFGSLCVGNPSSSAHSPDRQLLPPHDSTDRSSAHLMEEDVLIGIQNCSHSNIFWCLALQMGQDLTSSTELLCINHWKPLILLIQGKTCSHPPWFYTWLNPLIQFLPLTGVLPAEDLFLHLPAERHPAQMSTHLQSSLGKGFKHILAETGPKSGWNLVLRGHVKWKTHKK